MFYGNSILTYLNDKFLKEDPQSSSHWQYYHKFLEIDDELNIKKTVGFGDGKTKNKFLADLAHFIFQIPFLRKLRLRKIRKPCLWVLAMLFSLAC